MYLYEIWSVAEHGEHQSLIRFRCGSNKVSALRFTLQTAVVAPRRVNLNLPRATCERLRPSCINRKTIKP